MPMFNGAKNFVIKGGSFVINAENSSKSGLEPLLAEVAPNAILNAGGRADEVRCYPGTREEIIGRLEKWMDDENSRTSRMMWLKGPAGAGKSAIFQTVAERCNEHGRQAANFFFFRGDGTRNDAQPLVATLVYQLLRCYPSLAQLLTDSFVTQPLICKSSIEEQFRSLVSAPFKLIQQSSPIDRPIILIIDGLDECDDMKKQGHILSALYALAHADNSPFLVLVASRAEPHLVKFFNKLGASVKSIFLDKEYNPRHDIRRFVVAKFDEIKRDHHLALTLSDKWPAEADIDLITDKSSGHFVYAATVMRFIEYSSDSPALSLVIVRELRSSANHNPFADLDAIYSYVFSKARDIRAVKLILGANSMVNENMIEFTLELMIDLLGYSIIEVQSLFADLTSIIEVTIDDPIGVSFYHASMEDYLGDKSRSGVYHLDMRAVTAELASMCLQKFYDADSFFVATDVLCEVQEATPELSKSLLEASTRRLLGMEIVYRWDLLIGAIEKLYLQDKTELKAMMRRWVRFAHENNIDLSGDEVALKDPSAQQYYNHYCAKYARR